MIHFEDVWNRAETLTTAEAAQRSIQSLIMELTAKLGLYEAMDNNKLAIEEKQKLKSHLFGKLLILLAQISLKDDINVFSSMKTALEAVEVLQLEAKYH